MRIGNLSELMGSCPPESLRPDPGPNDATRMDWRKGRGDAAARTGRPTFVRGQSRSANDWEPGQPVAKISTIIFRISKVFAIFRSNPQVLSIFEIFRSAVASFFHDIQKEFITKNN